MPSVSETLAGTRRAHANTPKYNAHIAIVAQIQMLTLLAWSRNRLPNFMPTTIRTPLKKSEPKCNR